MDRPFIFEALLCTCGVKAARQSQLHLHGLTILYKLFFYVPLDSRLDRLMRVSETYLFNCPFHYISNDANLFVLTEA